MRYQRIERRVEYNLGDLSQCPACDHYFSANHNGHASERTRLGLPFTEALAGHCVPCGAEAETLTTAEAEAT